jgi:hypothetical protein
VVAVPQALHRELQLPLVSSEKLQPRSYHTFLFLFSFFEMELTAHMRLFAVSHHTPANRTQRQIWRFKPRTAHLHLALNSSVHYRESANPTFLSPNAKTLFLRWARSGGGVVVERSVGAWRRKKGRGVGADAYAGRVAADTCANSSVNGLRQVDPAPSRGAFPGPAVRPA